MTELNQLTGEPIGLKPANLRSFRGTKIPGAQLFSSAMSPLTVHLHLFSQATFQLSLLHLQAEESFSISIREQQPWLRLETLLHGEVQFNYPDGSHTSLFPGQYLLTDQPQVQATFTSAKDCRFFRIHYSPALLEQLGLPVLPASTQPRPLPALMLETIHGILVHPFAEQLRIFYYGNAIRELLFHHVSATDFIQPGAFSPQQLAFVYETDQYIAENLDANHTIRDLARRAGTNTFFLKKAYEQVFGIGIFPRLIQRRMEHAQFLLESTDLPLKDICSQSGYETLAGFITEFRKRFGQTPNQWRKGRRGGS